MRNIKFVCLFAACGFILSFVFGLFSHSSFLLILLKALIFGVIFAALGFLISFVFNKFLDDSDSDDSLSGDYSDLASKNSGDSQHASQAVDIVVEDEDLPSSDTDNHFVVGDNHQMLKSTDIKEDNLNEAVDDAAPEVHQFVPLRKTENSQNFSGQESVAPNEVGNVENVENLEDDIDTLPDMESLSFVQEGGTDESSSNSDFGSGLDSSVGSYKKSDESTPDVKDAALIAKAISTALAEEDS